MNEIEQKCKELLNEKNVDLLSEIDFDVNGKVHTLSFEYIIEAQYFLSCLMNAPNIH